MFWKLTGRMLTEVDRRLLAKFMINFGWKGIGAVRRFQRRLAKGEYFPAFLFLSVTNRCNLECQGCWVSQTTPPIDMDIDTLHRVVRECNRQGSYFFGILGGEPLLYDGLFDFIREHPKSYFLLFTNGTLITDETAAVMRKLGNVSPLISIEGNPAVSDVRRGGQDVYGRTMEGLEHCRRHRLVTGVATSVCRSNIDDLASRAFVDELVRRKVQYLWYYIYRPVGPKATPELALSAEQVLALRRFIVDVRCEAPMMIVDAYWDHKGKALCPAAVGIGHHITPDGYIEPCPPIQCSCDNIGNGEGLYDIFCHSEFLRAFRTRVCDRTRGCILMENPHEVRELMAAEGARDSSGRGTLTAELEQMATCPSHHVPGQEIPERNWMYRFAKKHWFFGFGAYG